MRVDESLCAFDQTRELMRVAKLQPVSKLSKIVQSGPVNTRIQQNLIFTKFCLSDYSNMTSVMVNSHQLSPRLTRPQVKTAVKRLF